MEKIGTNSNLTVIVLERAVSVVCTGATKLRTNSFYGDNRRTD